MREFVKDLLNRVLSVVGLHVMTRRAVANERKRYERLVGELQGSLREHLLPGTPDRDRRIPLIGNLRGTNPAEALHIVHYLHRGLPLDGDVCEFGVASGKTSALLANEIIPTNKSLWLYDSFEGLPAPTEKDELIDDLFSLGSIESYAGKMAHPRSQVEAELRRVGFAPSRTKIVEGFVEGPIEPANLPKAVCFAYVDFDFYQPILDVLRSLDPIMAVGGHFVVDDYGFFSSGVKAAVEEFLSARKDDYVLIVPPDYAGHFCVIEKKS